MNTSQYNRVELFEQYLGLAGRGRYLLLTLRRRNCSAGVSTSVLVRTMIHVHRLNETNARYLAVVSMKF